MIQRCAPLLLGLVLSAPLSAQAAKWSDVSLLDLTGQEVEATQLFAGGPCLITYTGVGCPIAGKLAPRLQSMHEAYPGVRFFGINANPQDARESIAEDVRELGFTFPVLRDFRQELTRSLGATTTTEVFLFDGAGELRYRGAVDDQYHLGTARPKPTQTWLKDALDAVLEGEPVAVEATDAPGCALTLLEPEELPETITWSSDVARIVQTSCQNCHREGQVGPFPLETYEQAKGWSKMIASVVEGGRMPPWNADPHFNGVFANERRLSDRDKAALLRWIDDGMPRGNPQEDPEPPTFAEGWRIGEPDAVFAMQNQMRGRGALPEEGYHVPREGVVRYQYFTVPTNFDEDRWVQAIEVKPGAADVVHHVLILVDDPEAGRFERSRQLDFRSYFAVAVPGDTPSVFPAGYGKQLPKGATLVFQVHYTPNGKERFDRSSIALRFCAKTPEYEVVTAALFEEDLRIPPGAAAHEVRAKKRIWRDTPVLGFFPHMHTRGKDFRYVLHNEDGTSEDLLRARFDFNWQESYLYPEPRVLPKGAHLEVIGHFDNSAANLNNPDPEAWVSWGDQTWEEMFIGYYDHVRPIQRSEDR